MSNIKNIPLLNKLSNLLKEEAYRGVYRYILEKDSKEDIKDAYLNILKQKYKYKKIAQYVEDYSFPSEAFMSKVDAEYKKDKQTILKLFSKGECLTFSDDFSLDPDSSELSKIKWNVEKEGKELVYPNAFFPLAEQYLFALFSDGTCFFNEEIKTKSELLNNLRKLVSTKGYKVNEPEVASYRFITKIHAYARKTNKPIIKTVNSPSKEHFIAQIFENNNICYNKTNLLEIAPEIIDKFAYFSDGQIFYPERYTLTNNREIYSKIRKFISEHLHKQVFLKEKIIPDDFLEAILDKKLGEEPAPQQKSSLQKELTTEKYSKTCVEIFSEILKKRAKKLGKSNNIPHHEALEMIAQINDFNNWKEVCEMTEAFAKDCLEREQEKVLYMKNFMKNPETLAHEKNISVEQAKKEVALFYGFESWERYENVSYVEVMLASRKK